MPNWCQNTTTLFHDNPKMLERVTTAITTRDHLLQEFVPMPDDIGEGWWGWAITNWGTKWDVVDCEIVETAADRVTITFLSAWNAPIEAYQKMEEQFGFRITSEYSEPGVGFRGTYKDGVHQTEEMDESDDEWIQW